MKIVIIGAGPGGYETAVLAAKRGADVTLVESKVAYRPRHSAAAPPYLKN